MRILAVPFLWAASPSVGEPEVRVAEELWLTEAALVTFFIGSSCCLRPEYLVGRAHAKNKWDSWRLIHHTCNGQTSISYLAKMYDDVVICCSG